MSSPSKRFDSPHRLGCTTGLVLAYLRVGLLWTRCRVQQTQLMAQTGTLYAPPSVPCPTQLGIAKDDTAHRTTFTFCALVPVRLEVRGPTKPWETRSFLGFPLPIPSRPATSEAASEAAAHAVWYFALESDPTHHHSCGESTRTFK